MFYLDDVIVFGKDGVMKVMKIADKMFVGKSLQVAFFAGMIKRYTIWSTGMGRAVVCMRRNSKLVA